MWFLDIPDQNSIIEEIIVEMKWTDCQFNEEQKATFIQLVHQYEDIFKPLSGKIEFTPILQHKIHLTDDTPIRTPSLHVAYALRQKVNDHIQELYHSGIIVPSLSPFQAPLVASAKKNGKIRVLVDFRHLNLKTVDQSSFAIPPIRKFFDVHNKKGV